MKNFFFEVNKNYHQSLEVSNITDFWTNQVCRRIAAVIVIIINPTSITPNMVTGLSFFLNLIANYQILSGELGLAALFFFISFIMDCVDGQLARKRDTISKFGIYLDLVLDGLKDLVTFIVLISYFSNGFFFNYSLLAMLIISFSLILDWVRKIVINKVKETKQKPSGIFSKYGIVFWSGPIRNFLIICCLTFKIPEVIILYSCFPGIYFTIRKGWAIIDLLKKNKGIRV